MKRSIIWFPLRNIAIRTSPRCANRASARAPQSRTPHIHNHTRTAVTRNSRQGSLNWSPWWWEVRAFQGMKVAAWSVFGNKTNVSADNANTRSLSGDARLQTHTQRNIFQVLLNQTEIRLYLPLSDWFGTKRTSVWFKINRKMINTI